MTHAQIAILNKDHCRIAIRFEFYKTLNKEELYLFKLNLIPFLIFLRSASFHLFLISYLILYYTHFLIAHQKCQPIPRRDKDKLFFLQYLLCSLQGHFNQLFQTNWLHKFRTHLLRKTFQKRKRISLTQKSKKNYLIYFLVCFTYFNCFLSYFNLEYYCFLYHFSQNLYSNQAVPFINCLKLYLDLLFMMITLRFFKSQFY
ncbi:transmembrane protein, putative (macronuclear) [Tetrahymena thermophila SB210]|uniref:Transmembrane protein, putative n=1 Tax=Tetrahymena thermophila (strain SB210) TaxID=312017 RepID=W7X4Q3_TETTS|nr:transmembrane protein, putative [Tetrahymena thermophila SB210]EWS71348.1 transmembrane protein, putative [Tetrahymena thermophila SB210]|eukprot:XP_012656122.1 transmembrane protein, putative [Tetrahymena thermophila SB210]